MAQFKTRFCVETPQRMNNERHGVDIHYLAGHLGITATEVAALLVTMGFQRRTVEEWDAFRVHVLPR